MRVRNLLIFTLLVLFSNSLFGQSYDFNFMNLNQSGVECGTGLYGNPFRYIGIVSGRHTPIYEQAYDTNTYNPRSSAQQNKLQMIPDGETMSMKLGNEEVSHLANGSSEGIRYEFMVDTLNSMLLLRFAVVFEEALVNDHYSNNKPFFKVTVTDADDHPMRACAEYEVYSGEGGQSGFNVYENTDTTLVRWRDWSTIGLDLSEFMGKQVKIEFVTKDCKGGDHFGYAYFHARCIPNCISAINCDDPANVTLVAPANFTSYSWESEGFPNYTNDTVTYPKPLTTQDTLYATCHIESFTACPIDFRATVVKQVDDPNIHPGINPIRVRNHCKGAAYKDAYFNIPASELSTTGKYVFINSLISTENCENPYHIVLIIDVVNKITMPYIYDKRCDDGNEYNNGIYHLANPNVGLYADTINVTHSHAGCCDSVYRLILTTWPTYDTLINDTLCWGDSYFFNPDWIVTTEVLSEHNYNPGDHYQGERPFQTIHGCDSMVNYDIYLAPVYHDTINATICQGQEYHNAVKKFDIINTDELTAGEYHYFNHDTLSICGCDSSMVLKLFVAPIYAPYIDAEICEGYSYVHPNDPTIHVDNPDVGTQDYIFPKTTLNGCDSTVTLTLTVWEERDTIITAYIGLGDTYNENGFDITPTEVTQPGYPIADEIEIDNVHDCDSIISLMLFVYDKYFNILDSICYGEEYHANGFNLNVTDHDSLQPGVYNLHRTVKKPNTDIDSLVYNVTLKVGAVYTTENNIHYDQVCNGTDYSGYGFNIPASQLTLGHNIFTSPADYSKMGCDSIAKLDLEVLDAIANHIYDTVCGVHEPYNNYGFNIPASEITKGSHLFTGSTSPSTAGCDSTAYLHLMVGQDTTVLLAIEGCLYTTVDTLGLSIPLNTPGESHHEVTLESASGCDSILRINMSVLPATRIFVNPEVCYGEGYDDNSYGQGVHFPDTLSPGVYTDTALYVDPAYADWYDDSGIECESYYIVNLTVWPVRDTLLRDTICSNYGYYQRDQFTFNGFDFGLRHDTVVRDTAHDVTIHNCDSTIYLEILVHPVLDTLFRDTICEYDEYVQHGFSYAANTLAPGLNIDTLMRKTIYGCDSIVNLELYVKDTTITRLYLDWCRDVPFDTFGFDFTPDEVRLYNEELTLESTLTGCDSTVYLSLDVHPVYHLSENISIGSNEGYHDHGFNYNPPYTQHLYKDTMPYYTNHYGCDSIWYLELHVLDTNSVSVRAEVCKNEIYAHDCKDSTIYYHGSEYSVGYHSFPLLFKNQAGVDSLVILTLNVKPLPINNIGGNDGLDWCQNENYNLNNFNVTPTSVAIHSYTDTIYGGGANDCDSIVNLKLNVHPVYDNTVTTFIGTGQNYTEYGFNLINPPAGYYAIDSIYHTKYYGCDSIWRLRLNVYDTDLTHVSAEVCYGDIYEHPCKDSVVPMPQYQYSEGMHDTLLHFLNQNNVDSLVQLTLTVKPLNYNWVYIPWCRGEHFDTLGFDITPTEVGLYYDTFVLHDTGDTNNQNLPGMPGGHGPGTGDQTFNYSGTSNGCDSIVYLTLDVHEVYYEEYYAYIGYGEDYNDHGFVYINPAINHYDSTKYLTTMDGCDSIVTLHLDVFETKGTYIHDSICFGESYDKWGFTYNTPAVGVIYDTLYKLTYQNVDSIVYLQLDINKVYDSTIYVNICYGEDYTENGFTYINKEVGDYFDSLLLQTTKGCDSIVRLELHVRPTYDYTIPAFIGTGYSYVDNGFEYILPAAGHYDSTLNLTTDIYGCDSIVHLSLDVWDTVQNRIYAEICEGESYFLNNFSFDQPNPGTYYDTQSLQTIHQVDSIVFLTLVVHDVYNHYFTEEICHGEDFMKYDSLGWPMLQPEVGEYNNTFNLHSQYGCDSTVNVHLDVWPTYENWFVDSLCYGLYNQHGFNIDTDTLPWGHHHDTLRLHSEHGCDSISYLDLNVLPYYPEIVIEDTICHKDSYNKYGFIIEDPDMGMNYAEQHWQTTSGCDSSLYLRLMVMESHDSTIYADICIGEDYLENNFEFLEPTIGVYEDSLRFDNESGCDSIVRLHLTVHPVYYGTYIKDTICYEEDYTLHGFNIIFPPLGLTQDTLELTSIWGCDSLVYLDLTVSPTYVADNIVNIYDMICEGEDYDQYGFHETGLSAGTHYDTLYLNSVVSGCDSIVALTLTVNITNETVVSGEICEGFDYIENGFNIVQPEAGEWEYQMTHTNMYGCDSTVFLALTVWPKMERHLIDSVCHGVDYLLDGFVIIQPDTGVYYDTLFLQTMYGCDSTVFMQLTVLPEYDTMYFDTICYGQDYLLHGFDYVMPEVGHYTDTLMLLTSLGCDSIIYLELTVNPVSDTLFTDIICQGSGYYEHGFDIDPIYVSGHHKDTLFLTNKYGCDSLVLLDLSVTSWADTMIMAHICEGQDYIENGFEYLHPEVGVYLDSLQVTPVVACDSMVYLTLVVDPNSKRDLLDTICEGENYTWLGFNFINPPVGDNFDTLYLNNHLGCDSIVTMILTVNPVDTIRFQEVICQHEVYDSLGFVWGDTLLPAIYYDTLHLLNQYGCDSTVFMELTVNPVHDTTFQDTICQNWAYDEHGFVYGDTLNAGLHLDTLFLTNEFGCDSIVYLELTVNPIHAWTLYDTICQGTPYDSIGFVYGDTLPSGLFRDVQLLTNMYGCDSTVYLELQVNPIHFLTFQDTICENWAYDAHGFVYGDTLTPGLHLDTLFLTNEFGCDSTVYLELQVNPIHFVTFQDTICQNWAYDSLGFVYGDTLTPGLFRDTLFLANQYGCDSTVYLELQVNPIHFVTILDTICENWAYDTLGFAFGDTLTPGLYYDTLFLTNEYGCDSTVYLELQVNPIHFLTFQDTICENWAYDAHGFVYGDTLTPGLHLDTLFLTNEFGCDSTVYLELTVNPIHFVTFQDTICQNWPYDSLGFVYGDTLTPGLFRDTLFLANEFGCDSTVYLELQVNPIHFVTILDTICENWAYDTLGFAFGDTLTPGLYYDTLFLANEYGCDSTVYLELQVNPIHFLTFQDTICENWAYDAHGFVYGDTLTPGLHLDTLFLTNEYGCDSTVYLELTVNPIHFVTFQDTICQNWAYDAHGFVYGDTLTPGLHLDTLFLANQYGCDSTVYLELTVNPIHEFTLVDTICQNWPYDSIGFVYGDTLTPGLFRDTLFLTNEYGCDSTVYLELQVNPIHFLTFQDTICENWAYDAHGFVYGDTLTPGLHLDTLFLANEYGCDSTVYLELQVNPIHFVTILDTICQNWAYDAHGFVYGDTLMPGLHLDTLFLTNEFGCDSTVYLELMVNPIHDTLFQDTICQNWAYDAHGFVYGDTLIPGLFRDTLFLTNQYGCDSTVYLELQVNPIHFLTFQDTICENWAYDAHGFVYGDTLTPGLHLDTLFLANEFGCDSTVYLELQVNPIHFVTILDTICENWAYDTLGFAFGDTLTPGLHYDTLFLANEFGCDSTVYLELMVNPIHDTLFQDTICQNWAYDAHGFVYGDTLMPGLHLDTLFLTNEFGCDSTVYLELMVNPIHAWTFVDTICQNWPYDSLGFVYGDTLTPGLHLDTLFLANEFGCDSTVYLELQVNPIHFVTILDTICQNWAYDTLGFAFGDTLTPGLYYDTLFLANQYGCDSTVYLELQVNPIHDTLFQDTICQNWAYDAHGFVYGDTLMPGLHLDTLFLTNEFGCDSTVYLELMVNPIHAWTFVDTICQNWPYDSLGFVYGDTLTPGLFRDTLFLANEFGCDSTVYLELQVNPIHEYTLVDTICQNWPYDSIGFVYGDTLMPGLFRDTLFLTNEFGCDSTVYLELQVNPINFTYIVDTICEGMDYFDYGFADTLPDVGMLYDTLFLANEFGCDSTVYLELYIGSLDTTLIVDTICQNWAYDSLGFVYGDTLAPGLFRDTLRLQSMYGCDSIVYLELTVNPVHDTLFQDTICQNWAYDDHGFVYGDTLMPGLFLDTLFLTNIYGCDSIVYLELMVNPIHDTLFVDTICANWAYNINGFELDSLPVGMHYDTLFLTNEFGCDSTVYLELMVNPIHDTLFVDTICFGEPYAMHGFDLDSLPAGLHFDTLFLTNEFGCDSTIYLELRVGSVDTVTILDTICYGMDYFDYGFNDTLPDVGMLYDTLHLVSMYGCDSTVYLELTINPVHDTLFVDTICVNEAYTLHGFDLDSLQVGMNYDTLFLDNQYGCDSIVYLELMVNPTHDTLFVDTICYGMDYTLHGFDITAPAVGNHNATLNLVNQYGCDSTVYLELTVNPVHDTLFVETICQGFDYIENGFVIIQPAPGYYLDSLTLTNIYGCDSIVYLELTVNPRHDIDIFDMICEGQAYDSLGFEFGDTLVPDTYFDTLFLVNQFGCDSIVSLTLQVNPVFDYEMQDTICFGNDYTSYGFSFIQPQPGINYQTLYLSTIYGCDSIVTMDLWVHELHDTVFVEHICYGESFDDDINNFHFDIPEVGDYEVDTVYPDMHGCDSTVYLQLHVHPVYDITIYDSICEGESYDTLGFHIIEPPLWMNYDTLFLHTDIWGCDSIVKLELDVMPFLEFSDAAHQAGPKGQTNVWAATNLQTGHYVYTIDSVENCRKYTWSFQSTDPNWYRLQPDSIGTTCDLWVFYEFTDTLMVKIGNMCNYDSIVRPITAKFFGDYEDEGTVRIFPNPTDGRFIVDGDDITEVTIESMWGQIVMRKKYDRSGKVVVYLHDVPRGTYLVIIDTENGKFYRYVVVDK